MFCVLPLGAKGGVVALYWCGLAIGFHQAFFKGGPSWMNGVCLWESPAKVATLIATLASSILLSVAFLRAPSYAPSGTARGSRLPSVYVVTGRVALMPLALGIGVTCLDYAGCPRCDRFGVLCYTIGPKESAAEAMRRAAAAKGVKPLY